MEADPDRAVPAGLDAKTARCREILQGLSRVVVAFSAGVDSALLLALAVDVVGRENVLAAMGISASLPERERRPGDTIGLGSVRRRGRGRAHGLPRHPHGTAIRGHCCADGWRANSRRGLRAKRTDRGQHRRRVRNACSHHLD